MPVIEALALPVTRVKMARWGGLECTKAESWQLGRQAMTDRHSEAASESRADWPDGISASFWQLHETQWNRLLLLRR